MKKKRKKIAPSVSSVLVHTLGEYKTLRISESLRDKSC